MKINMMKLETEDKIISEFLQSIGSWSDYVVITGGYALFIYKLYLADKKLENPPIGTRDIDSLISRKIHEISKKSIAKHLLDAGFVLFFKNRDIPAAQAYVKEIDGIEVEIEFLTDSSTRKDKDKNVVIAGVVAQPLSYLTLSLETFIKFQTYSGESGKVVSPGTWMFHKGLTFTKRKSLSKMHKDLYGIWYVSTQLGEFSEKAVEEYHRLTQQHSKWFTTLKNNLGHWVENASPSEWSQLETQDPSGNLKRLAFERILKKLTTPSIFSF